MQRLRRLGWVPPCTDRHAAHSMRLNVQKQRGPWPTPAGRLCCQCCGAFSTELQDTVPARPTQPRRRMRRRLPRQRGLEQRRLPPLPPPATQTRSAHRCCRLQNSKFNSAAYATQCVGCMASVPVLHVLCSIWDAITSDATARRRRTTAERRKPSWTRCRPSTTPCSAT